MSKYVTQKMADICQGPRRPTSSAQPTRCRSHSKGVDNSTHITGGTIMGNDTGTSVVSPHLHHWDARNLFVVGASVFAHNAGTQTPNRPTRGVALARGNEWPPTSSARVFSESTDETMTK